ncbi:MAG TPA: DedA family protein, partial [Caulobacteraceae bacterium]|nr:DedA family protein [Caulobacteraceae bacterium]
MLVTLASGIAHFSFPVFVAASIVTRGGRFFLEASLLRRPKAKAVIDRYFHWLAVAGVALIIGAFVLLRLLGGG